MPTLPVRGVDISILAEVEALGGRYRQDGVETDLFDVLVRHGVNTVRLRLWVDPHDEHGAPYLGGTNDLATTIGLARRAAERGLDLLLDLHYSDFWADPKKQSMPKAWQALTGDALERQVEAYTRDVVGRLVAEGLAPAMVQVGNEITNGMLWPYGRTPTYLPDERRFADVGPDEHRAAYDRLAGLLRRGVAAVRETAPDARVMLHLDAGGSVELYRGWLAEMTGRGVELDVVGLSFYPFWHGSLADLATTMSFVVERYGLDVLVVETAYGHRVDEAPGAVFTAQLAEAGGFGATEQGQHDFLVALTRTVAQVPGGHGLGLVYWEPGWLPVPGTSWASTAGMRYGDDVGEPGNHWAALALFDADGNALRSWSAFGGL